MLLYKVVVQFYERIFSVIVISIDNSKRLFYKTFAGKNGLAGSPRFGTAFRFCKACRQIIELLECIFHLCDFADAVADDFLEIFLQILADDEDYFVEAGFQCIVDGIIHDDLPVWSYWLKLFDSLSKSAADSGCHDHKCCFLHSVFPFSFPLFSLVYSINNRSCRPIVIRSVYYYASSCMLLSFAA